MPEQNDKKDNQNNQKAEQAKAPRRNYNRNKKASVKNAADTVKAAVEKVKEAAPKAVQNKRPANAKNSSPARAVQTDEQKIKASVQKKASPRRGRGGKNGNETLKIIPLGGIGEVGKNITVLETSNSAIVIDCGIAFPDDGMLGIDLVLPDFSYLHEIKHKLNAIFITHGHEDHIGGLPYLLKELNKPVFGTKLSIGLIEGKLKEHNLLNKAKLHVHKAGDKIKIGSFIVEFINVNHSIPDACAFAVETPAGTVVHTGDFKIDLTPIAGNVINLARFGELGSKGILALMADSTNAERPGSTQSERTVGESFKRLFASAYDKRLIIATFASNVHRVQQIFDSAIATNRKVAVSGRSMENVISKSIELGYLDIPEGVMIDIEAVSRYKAEKVCIVTTGSQGEPMSALTRMAMGDHRKVTVTKDDCIIISATPIPGNEKFITKVINELLKTGAKVVYENMYDIHVSGHACQEELKMMLAMTKPKFFIPVHGEFKHVAKHAELARSMGIPEENIIVPEIGKVIEVDNSRVRFGGNVPSGQVFVDGLGVGDVGSVVIRDRKHLSQDGLIIVVATINRKTGAIVSGPDIVSRGFVYVRESEDIIEKARKISREAIEKCVENNTREWGVIKQKIRDDIGSYIWQITKRNPMILPIIQEI